MHTETQVNVETELSEARVGRLHRTLGVLITLMTMFDGYDTFNPAYVIHYVAGPWGLTPGQAGFLVSSGLVGFLVGAAGHGAVADRLGRRRTMIAGLWLVNLFTLLTPLLGHGFAVFCGMRMLTGIGLGVLLPLGTTYINELAPRRVSNVFSLWGVTLGWSLGGTVAGLVGVFLTPRFGWEILYWVGALSIPLTFVLQAVLPESPRFLAAKGRTEELRALLGRLRPERAASYAAAALVLPPVPRVRNPIAALLEPRYRRVSLTIWATSFLSLFCVFGLTGWIPTVMMQRGESFAASFGFGALMQMTSFLGGLTLAGIVDRRPSRATRFLSTWWLVGGFSVLVLLFADSHVVNLVSVAASGFFIVGAQHVLNNFTASSYETGMRASAVGMELGVGRVGAILGPFVAGLLQSATHGSQAMFWTLGIAALVGAGTIASLGLRGPQAPEVQLVRS
ncbi:MAG TPA: MFS transporter [Aliidongia sp.]|uniref:MFS transporter n=1 Tax=Aliidongia sp. TaxID=1914230 RepID=UPI002DDD04BE|nr:MFS transporter [Aliidongia sp.]HEV2677400.1 MFS transporter [Aliidongia sp.]